METAIATEALHIEPPANTQESYDRIVEWFSQPGVKLAKNCNKCFYRGDKNPESTERCAIGCQFPNALYNYGLDSGGGTSIEGIYLEGKFTNLERYFKNVDVEFLKEAQLAHDSDTHSVEEFLARLKDVARDFNLTVKSK